MPNGGRQCALPPGGQFDSHEDHFLLSRLRKFSYSIGGIGSGLTDFLAETYIMTFYTVILQVNPLAVGAAMVWPRVLDAITDPVMGWISDRTRSRWGRRRPYLLYASPVLALLTILMFTPPETLSERGTIVYLAIVCALYYTAYTVVNVPYGALGLELSLDYHERTRVQTWKNAIQQISMIFIPSTWWLAQRSIFPNERVGTMWVVCGVGVLMILAYWLTFWGTREQAEVQSQASLHFLAAFRATFTNGPFILVALACTFFFCSLFSVYSLATYVSIFYVFRGDHEGPAALMSIGGILSILNIGGTVFWGWVGIKAGKRNAMLLCMLTLALTAPLSWFLYTPEHPSWQLIYGAIYGLCFSGSVVLPSAMMADICDVDEIRTGRRREGAYAGVMGFLFKLGFSLPFLITGFLLHLVGFDEKAEMQSEQTLLYMRLILAFLPIALIALVALAFLFYPLSEARVREMRAELEARRQARGEADATTHQEDERLE